MKLGGLDLLIKSIAQYTTHSVATNLLLVTYKNVSVKLVILCQIMTKLFYSMQAWPYLYYLK